MITAEDGRNADSYASLNKMKNENPILINLTDCSISVVEVLYSTRSKTTYSSIPNSEGTAIA
jgi:hypothetical protein